ncbi:MAG: hypothetical protein DMG27_09690 [Acidobacteria bacterium]|nr:MAG: hypothetical protein DMG27_09690 [Acidobacteriota bacterium]
MKSHLTVSGRIFELLALLCLFAVTAESAKAQFKSGFEGTVTDPTGATIPNAKIVVTNRDTNVKSETVSGTVGTFRITALPEGKYGVEVEAPGFKPWIQADLLLESNQVKTLYPVLSVGEQKTTVEVKAAVAAVETAKSDTSRQIDERTIDEAPLLGRNIYTSMIQLAPGVTGSGLPRGGALGSGSANNDSFEQEPGYEINASGQRQENNEYEVDGSSVNGNSRDGIVNLTPEPDFVEAVRISAVTFSASKGRDSGAYIQVFTKPGTNEIHGTLSEFHTNNDLTSRTIFQTCPPGSTGCHAVPVFRRNEFGGTLGGPLIKNKLFGFGGIFILRSSNAATQVATVETPQFTQWVSQNLPNRVADAFFSSAPPAAPPTTGFLTVAQLEALTPSHYPAPANLPPNLPAVGTGFFDQSPTHNAYQWHGRVDYNFNGDKDRMFFNWFRTYSDQLQTDPRAIYRVKVPNHGIYGKVNWIHTFSPTLLNEVSWTGVKADGSNPGTYHNKNLPNAFITGVSGFSQWGPAGWVHDNYNWHDVLTWTRGRHTIETGFEADRQHDDDNFTSPLLRPGFGFANLLDFAQDLPFSQSGPTVKVSSGALADDLYQLIRLFYVGAFVQDDFKVTPRLTFNLGLRFDYFGHWGTYKNQKTPFPFFTPGSGSSFAEQVASGTMSVRDGNKSYVVNNVPTGWGPRVGFGWDVFGNGKFAVRGGYGIFYNRLAGGSFSFPARANPPTWASPNFNVFNNQPFSYALGDPSGSLWPLPSGLTFRVNSAGGLVGIPVYTSGEVPHMDQPRTHSWMLSLQRDMGHDVLIEGDYNGSHSDNLFTQTDVNRFPGDLVIHNGTQTRLNPFFGPIVFGRTMGVADGNYGTFMVSKRFRQNWSLRGIFTVGKSTDYLSSNDNGTTNGEAILNPLDVAAQHGLSDYDVGRRFTLDSVVNIPVPWREGMAARVLGGWHFSTIATLQSGQPFTVFSSAPYNVVNGVNVGGDFNADGYDYDTPDTPSFGNKKSASRSDFITGAFPASAFPVPAPGHQGNLGRNTFQGPGLANANVEFSKASRIPWFTSEGASLEIRADIFNLFNRVNLTNPVSDLASSLFGRSTSQILPRAAQFGIHISY